MNDRLSAEELAHMMGCKINQRSRMIRWLQDRHWKYDIDVNGVPIVYRAYRDRKLGLSDEKPSTRYADAPNRQAFAK